MRLSANNDLLLLRIVPILIVSLLLLIRPAEGCAAQYRKELRYLDYYLGIAPANEDGSFQVNRESPHQTN
jgi:hypothetical protein